MRRRRKEKRRRVFFFLERGERERVERDGRTQEMEIEIELLDEHLLVLEKIRGGCGWVWVVCVGGSRSRETGERDE